MAPTRPPEPLETDPLWYDRVEPDEPPGRLLLWLAGAFSVLADLHAGSKRFLRAILD